MKLIYIFEGIKHRFQTFAYNGFNLGLYIKDSPSKFYIVGAIRMKEAGAGAT